MTASNSNCVTLRSLQESPMTHEFYRAKMKIPREANHGKRTPNSNCVAGASQKLEDKSLLIILHTLTLSLNAIPLVL